jgi:hypothetical protein
MVLWYCSLQVEQSDSGVVISDGRLLFSFSPLRVDGGLTVETCNASNDYSGESERGIVPLVDDVSAYLVKSLVASSRLGASSSMLASAHCCFDLCPALPSKGVGSPSFDWPPCGVGRRLVA